MNTTGWSVLVVDNDAQEGEKIVRALAAAGYSASCKADSLDGLVAVETQSPTLVVLHWGMPLIDGAVFTRALRAGLPQPPPVVAFAHPSVDPASVRSAGASGWLPAPPDIDTLVHLVRMIFNSL